MPGRMLPQQMFNPTCDLTPFDMQDSIAGLLNYLAEDTRAAAAAAAAAAAPPNVGTQGVLLRTCLAELLHNLLLLSKNFAVLIMQHQQEAPTATAATTSSSSSSSGTSSSSGSSAGGIHSDIHAAGLSDEVAAGTMLVASRLFFTVQACTADLGPAAACLVGQESQSGTQQQQQQTFIELLRPRLAAIFAHFDMAARVVAAVKASTATPGPLFADRLLACLHACSCFMGESIRAFREHWASQSGFDSREQRQLFSLQASILKMSAYLKTSNSGSSGSSGSNTCDLELHIARLCTLGVADAAYIAIGQDLTAFAPPPAAAATDAAPAGPSNQQQQQHQQSAAAAAAMQLLPSVVMFGRVCLQWAQELREQAIEVQQGQQARRGVLHTGVTAAAVCCNGFEPLAQLTGGQESAHGGANILVGVLAALHTWLGHPHVSAQLAAAGYKPQELLQQLELLSSAPAAAAAAAAAGQQPMTQVLQPLLEQLQVVGTALSSLAVPAFCNNPACSNVSGPTEVLLVSGRSCICAGCRTARYCSRECHRQHWKVHKPVCQALAAAAAASPVAATEAAEMSAVAAE